MQQTQSGDQKEAGLGNLLSAWGHTRAAGGRKALENLGAARGRQGYKLPREIWGERLGRKWGEKGR